MASWSIVGRHPLFSLRLLKLSRNPKLVAQRAYSYSVPPITKVEKIILDSIKATGPLPFATYIQLCLSHPTHGYYKNPSNPVFGSQGDFITSPEISQVFGELVGVWLLSQWLDAGRSPHLRLIELGPGRGTLMADILRVVSKFAPEKQLKDIYLVETSPTMRDLQEAKLQSQAERIGCNLHWRDSIDDVPSSEGFSMIVAHEFFDALPFHLLQKTQNGWQEVVVASNLDHVPVSTTYPRLRRVLSPIPTAASTVLGLSSSRFQPLPLGSFIEVSPASFKMARQIGKLLETRSGPADTTYPTVNQSGGCGLIIDYGDANVFGNSFRAFKNHKIVDVFDQPGECDLTTNVDFTFLQEAMGDLEVVTHGPISQSTFLESMGLQVRLSQLIQNAKEERRATIRDAATRLVDRTGMGTQYQVMGVTSSGGAKTTKEVWPFVHVQPKHPSR